MINLGNFDVLGLKITACDHDFILKEIKNRLKNKKNFLITPLASQTFVLAFFDKKLNKILESYDYLFSDSLWVKRSMNFLYNSNINKRVRGSNLLLNVCSLAQKNRYTIFLYGTTGNTLSLLAKNLKKSYPQIKITGFLPSVFKPLSSQERTKLIQTIEKSGAQILLLALGSPLEQIFSYELIYNFPKFKKPIIIIPFGAAFDFISGVKPTAPIWMQNFGVEWFFRCICEPERLWKRYFLYGPVFLLLILLQKIKLLFNLPHNIIRKSEVNS